MDVMTTTLDSPEQRIVLDNISWEIYESLLLAHLDCSVPHFTYDKGQLEPLAWMHRVHEKIRTSS